MRLADSDNGDKEGREVNYPSVLRQAVSIPDRKRPACAKGDGRSIFQKREDRRKSNKRERKRSTRTTTATPWSTSRTSRSRSWSTRSQVPQGQAGHRAEARGVKYLKDRPVAEQKHEEWLKSTQAEEHIPNKFMTISLKNIKFFKSSLPWLRCQFTEIADSFGGPLGLHGTSTHVLTKIVSQALPPGLGSLVWVLLDPLGGSRGPHTIWAYFDLPEQTYHFLDLLVHEAWVQFVII